MFGLANKRILLVFAQLIGSKIFGRLFGMREVLRFIQITIFFLLLVCLLLDCLFPYIFVRFLFARELQKQVMSDTCRGDQSHQKGHQRTFERTGTWSSLLRLHWSSSGRFCFDLPDVCQRVELKLQLSGTDSKAKDGKMGRAWMCA